MSPVCRKDGLPLTWFWENRFTARPRKVTPGVRASRPLPVVPVPAISIFRTVLSPRPTAFVLGDEPGCV